MKNSLFIKELLNLKDKDYKEFNSKLIPTIDKDSMIGIRTPTLRALAKKLYKENKSDVNKYLNSLPHYYYEENNLHAFLIEQINDMDLSMSYTEQFLPFIDNWATCDCFSPKIFKKYPDCVLEKIRLWIKSDRCYVVRYAIGLLLSNYLDNEYKKEYLELVSKVDSDEYYINMMIAWYFSTALVKHYNDTIEYLKNNKLKPWVHNKTIQKATESYRIPVEIKEYLKTLKRH